MSLLPKSVRIPPAVLWTEMNDDVLIMDANNGEYFKLAKTGARLWRSWSQDGSVENALEAVMQAVAVDRATLVADVAGLIVDMTRKGVLEVEDA